MINKILVALDNSDISDKVMLQALELAGLYRAQLMAVSVINYSALSEFDPASSGTVLSEVVYNWTDSFQKVLDKCERLAKERNIGCVPAMLSGIPAEEIIKYAQENKADLIVMGHIGKTAAAGLLLGSVSQGVSAHSKCSVMIVK